MLAAPGESTVAAQVASNFAELLGSERVANLAARTGLVLAGAALARTTLVLSANRTAAQLAASVQVPCFVIERGASLPNEVALPLWARQEILSLPVADATLGREISFCTARRLNRFRAFSRPEYFPRLAKPYRESNPQE